jgi:multimeric flavodoxin WrbA
MILAMQHGMVWVGLGMKPGNNHSKGSSADLNRVGSFLGAMAQANADQGVEGIAPSDFATMEALGKRVAEIARRQKAGTSQLAEAA